jgi:protease I
MNILNISGGKEDSLAVAPIPERLKKHERIIIITGDKNQDLEFFYPYYRLTEEGYDVDVATPDGGAFEGKHGMGLENSKGISEVRPEDYALLYIPGGKAPKSLRENDEIIRFVQEFAQSGKPIASICHGAQILITAGLVEGKQIAAWPEIRDEVEEAGATFVDEALVEDGQFITARMPGDLHRHLAGVLDYLSGKKSATQRRRRAG